MRLFCAPYHRYAARVFEAWALLKICLAVAHAAFVSEINLAPPSGHFRVAGKRRDTKSQRWHQFFKVVE
jgi:hypothetical protein